MKRKENREKMENKKKIIMVNSTLQQLVICESCLNVSFTPLLLHFPDLPEDVSINPKQRL